MSGIFDLMCSSTFIALATPTSIPAALAISEFGLTPVPNNRRSAAISLFLLVLIRSKHLASGDDVDEDECDDDDDDDDVTTSCNPSPKITLTPLFSNSFLIISAISLSSKL